MSGIEGIGISLGVLSLVVSSIEHYEDVFRPFQRYKAFAPEIARFERRLLAQKTIFRSQCQLLLIPLIDVETTTKMIDEKGKHQMWRSAELEQSLKDNLGQSAEACVATMIDMEEQLKTVQGKAQGYLPDESASKKGWKAHFRKRMKKLEFSISEQQIDRCIARLRDLNHDFSTLSTQTSKLLAISQTDTIQPHAIAELSYISAIREFHRIREASINFCEALSDACSLHVEHQAHLRVFQPSKKACHQSEEDARIRFSVGLLKKNNRVTRGTRSYDLPVWFSVASLLESMTVPRKSHSGDGVDMEEMARLTRVLKRSPSPSLSSGFREKARVEKKESSKKPTLDQAGLEYLTPPSSLETSPNYRESPILGPSTYNFCDAKDLCLHLSRMCKRTVIGPDSCLGFLIKEADRHDIYFNNQKEYAENSISFSKLIASMADEDHLTHSSIPLLERVRLAKNIALVVLQFHTSPLLQASWNGDDILFYGIEVPQNQSSYSTSNKPCSQEEIPEPYLKIKVSNNDTRSYTSRSQTPQQQTPPIRNPYLFRLGIVLLEIAHQTPLHIIGRRLQEANSSEFDIADHYSKTVGSLLGPRYAKIVRRCLGCDFGHDVDLESEGLRVSVHQNVVLELEDMIQDFRKKLDIL